MVYLLTQTNGSRSIVERFAFGKADGRKGGQPNGRMQHRTILMMGATGSGKTTLINGMINYIFNVQDGRIRSVFSKFKNRWPADLKLTARQVASPPTTSNVFRRVPMLSDKIKED